MDIRPAVVCLAVGMLPAAFSPPTLAAQAEPDLVPRELVLALIPRFTMDEPELFVGELPDDLPPILVLPPDSRPLGAMDYGPLEALFLISPLPADVAEDRTRERLLEGGWRAATADPTDHGGFRDSRFPTAEVLCATGGQSLTIDATAREEGGSQIGITYQEGDGDPRCGDRPRARRGPQYRDFPMPVLPAPDGASQRSTSSGSGNGYAESRAMVETSLSPADLVAHYAGHLRAAGWRLGAEASTGSIVVQTWSGPGAERWFGYLLAVAPPGSDDRREVVFTIMDPDGGSR
ncbi:MAG: hypothetical protein ACRELV_05395 [Longimicrobiales bacterium]